MIKNTYLDKILVDEDVSDLLRKHNMKKIAGMLNERIPDLKLDTICEYWAGLQACAARNNPQAS